MYAPGLCITASELRQIMVLANGYLLVRKKYLEEQENG